MGALRDAGHQVQGLDLMVDGRVPQGAGLSSSVALECAVAAAVFDLFDLDLDLGLLRDDSARATLAEICVMAEKRDCLGPDSWHGPVSVPSLSGQPCAARLS